VKVCSGINTERVLFPALQGKVIEMQLNSMV